MLTKIKSTVTRIHTLGIRASIYRLFSNIYDRTIFGKVEGLVTRCMDLEQLVERLETETDELSCQYEELESNEYITQSGLDEAVECAIDEAMGCLDIPSEIEKYVGESDLMAECEVEAAINDALDSITIEVSNVEIEVEHSAGSCTRPHRRR